MMQMYVFSLSESIFKDDDDDDVDMCSQFNFKGIWI